MKILIRRILPKDYLKILQVIKNSIIISWKNVRHDSLIQGALEKYSLQNFKKKAKEIDYFVAEEKNSSKLLGIIGLKNNELRTFFVDSIFQRKGIGRQLYDYLENVAKKRNIEKIITKSSEIGEPIYRKFGFQRVGKVIKKINEHSYIEIDMKKVL